MASDVRVSVTPASEESDKGPEKKKITPPPPVFVAPLDSAAMLAPPSGARKPQKQASPSSLSVPAMMGGGGGAPNSLAVPKPGGVFPLPNSQQMASSGSATGEESSIYTITLSVTLLHFTSALHWFCAGAAVWRHSSDFCITTPM